MIYFLKSKSDVVRATKRFIADISPYGTIKHFRTDNGAKFTSAEFKSLLIWHIFTNNARICDFLILY